MDLAELGLHVDASGSIRAVDEFGAAATRTANATLGLEGAFRKLGPALGAVGLGLTAGALFSKLIHETIAFQDTLNTLEGALKTAGTASGQTADGLRSLAEEMQRTTTASDTLTMAAQTMLLRFDKIRGQTFPQTIKVAADMAARLGMDLPNAARMLGMALQDPENGMQRLRRSGVTFTESQKDMVRQLFATGEYAKAQGIILDILGQKFNGAASEARNTLGGALKVLTNDISSLFEMTKDETSGLVTFIQWTDKAVVSLRNYRDEIKAVALALTGYAAVAGGAKLVGLIGKFAGGGGGGGGGGWDSPQGTLATNAGGDLISRGTIAAAQAAMVKQQKALAQVAAMELAEGFAKSGAGEKAATGFIASLSAGLLAAKTRIGALGAGVSSWFSAGLAVRGGLVAAAVGATYLASKKYVEAKQADRDLADVESTERGPGGVHGYAVAEAAKQRRAAAAQLARDQQAFRDEQAASFKTDEWQAKNRVTVLKRPDVQGMLYGTRMATQEASTITGTIDAKATYDYTLKRMDALLKIKSIQMDTAAIKLEPEAQTELLNNRKNSTLLINGLIKQQAVSAESALRSATATEEANKANETTLRSTMTITNRTNARAAVVAAEETLKSNEENNTALMQAVRLNLQISTTQAPKIAKETYEWNQENAGALQKALTSQIRYDALNSAQKAEQTYNANQANADALQEALTTQTKFTALNTVQHAEQTAQANRESADALHDAAVAQATTAAEEALRNALATADANRQNETIIRETIQVQASTAARQGRINAEGELEAFRRLKAERATTRDSQQQLDLERSLETAQAEVGYQRQNMEVLKQINRIRRTTGEEMRQSEAAELTTWNAMLSIEGMMSDALVGFVEQGKSAFTDLFNSFRRMLLKMVADLIAQKVFKKLFFGGGEKPESAAAEYARTGVNSFFARQTGGGQGGAGAGDGAAAAGGPIVLFAAVAATLVTSIFSQASAIKQQKRELDEGIKEWNKSLDGWTQDIRRRGSGQFASAVNEATDRYNQLLDGLDELRKKASEIGTSQWNTSKENDRIRTNNLLAYDAQNREELAKLTQAYQEAIAAAKQLREELKKRFIEDLRVETLRSQGRGQEADALSREIAFREKLNTAIKEFGPFATDAIAAVLEWNQAMEDAAAAAAVLANTRAREDYEVRRLRASGQASAAADMEFRLQQEREYQDAVKAGLDSLTLAALKLAQAAEAADRAAQLAEARTRSREDLIVRGYAATGNSTAADDARFQFGQRREVWDAKRAGASPLEIELLTTIQNTEAQNRKFQGQIDAVNAALDAQLAALGAQKAVAEESLRTAQDQLQAQEQQVAQTQQLIESLQSFAAGLKIGPLSTLNPSAQLALARQQFEATAAAALGGDRTAADKFPETARQFLDLSRQFNASGMNYVRDFDRVQSLTTSMVAKFGAQQTVEEQMLATLRQQVQFAERQVADLQAAMAAAQTAADAQIAAIAAAQKDANDRAKEIIDKLLAQLLKQDALDKKLGARGFTVTGMTLYPLDAFGRPILDQGETAPSEDPAVQAVTIGKDQLSTIKDLLGEAKLTNAALATAITSLAEISGEIAANSGIIKKAGEAAVL